MKRALVVDDSSTARTTLRNMLEKYDLEVDTAVSAEEALDYLVHRHPNVVFMDHTMPGMSGFQALKAIKNDPNTAMIPIMMYTSKEGEVYIGQARALGAVDVLNKDLKHVELHQALKRLHLVGENSNPHETGLHLVPMLPPVADPDPDSDLVQDDVAQLANQLSDAIDLSRFRRQMQKLLEEQRHKLRHDVEEAQESVAVRLSEQLDAAEARAEAMAADRVRPWKAAFWSTLILLALVTAAMVFAGAQLSERLAALTAGLSSLHESGQGAAGEESLADEVATLGVVAPSVQSGKLYEAIEWAINSTGQYPYDQVALGDETLQLLNGLVTRLASAEFEGVVRLEVHTGDFCLVTNDAGEQVLAASDLPLNECGVIGFSEEDSIALGERQSLGFANFLASSPLLNGTGLNVVVESVGNVRPLQTYPAPSSVQNAGAWNGIARRNNRIRVSIIEG